MSDRYSSDRNGRPSQRPPARRVYDGVEYEPSSAARRRPSASSSGGQRRPSADTRRRPPASRPRKKTRKKGKSSFAAFYILTLLAGVIICVVLFAMVFNAVASKNPGWEDDSIHNPAEDLPPVIEDSERRTLTGMITALDAEATPRAMTILDFETGREDTYLFIEGTAIRNRYSSPITYADLTVGRIVDAGYDNRSKHLNSLNENTQAWEQRFKSNVKIDTEQSTLLIGNDVYHFNSQTLVRYKNEAYSVGRITPMDTVSLSGYLDKVWYIQLETNHGFLRLDNISKVENGTLAIDTSIFMGLAEATESIQLVEGTHRVIVEGSNIEQYILDVEVKSGETTMVDLINTTPRKAFLLVAINEPDSTVIIDGVSVTEPGAAEISYGEHSVRVEKDGFVPVQQEVTITQNYTELKVELAAIVKNGRLVIYTSPAQAEIFVDSAFVGYSTLTYATDAGVHTVTARKTGYHDQTINVQVAEGDNAYHLILDEKAPAVILPTAVPDYTPDTSPVTPDRKSTRLNSSH